MSKEKQIEEMAKIFSEAEQMAACWSRECNECKYYETNGEYCRACHGVEALYDAGYRKQSEGEWVRVMNHKECSKCGYNAPYKKIKAGYHLQDLAKFCPNCGAKMKVGE